MIFVTLYYINITSCDFFLISTGSGIGSKYLTFLDLGLQAYTFSNVDDGTLEVELPSTIYVGINTFHSLHVRITHYLLQYYICFYFHLDKLKWVS